MQDFELTERHDQAGYREIAVKGELDLAVSGQLADALYRAVTDSMVTLISLEACEFIDSTGIAVIVNAHNTIQESGGNIAVFGPTAQVLRILTVTGLTDNGMVFASADEALKAITAR